MHHCDNKGCDEPLHLFLGTQADNMADMASKGRGRSGNTGGEGHPRAKLNAAQVKEIRNMVANGARKAVVAQMYGVTTANIRAIVNGRTWAADPGAARTKGAE